MGATRRTRGSSTGRPIMALLDLLGRRWALRILWELREDRRLSFRELGAASGLSPSVLNTRLRELREAALVELGPGGYAVGRLGRELQGLLLPLNAWAERWARER